ncbi:Crp/Fnr family transcriptional regulator [Actinomadura vinacea]|uniref:Crp/Fnr family transcriptional regulator n=1 Tax=Actinomadura vinacea TaxID=115336 RepID=A0ABN3J356_9ACTN
MSPLEPGSFLAELTPEERADLESRGRFRDLGRGEVLFHEGEMSTWVAVLVAGRVKAFSDREHGGEALLDVRGPGSLLGEVAAIDGLPRSATVATLEPARVLALTEEEFMSFLRAHGRVSILIMKMLCRRWRDADRRRVEFGMFDATGRVAQRLVELAERFGVPYEPGGRSRAGGGHGTRPNGSGARPGAGSTGPGTAGRGAPRPGRPGPQGDRPGDATSVQITLSLSQEELAGWVGASREAVSKALGTLRRHGWIETGRRRVIVHDLQALRRHAR